MHLMYCNRNQETLLATFLQHPSTFARESDPPSGRLQEFDFQPGKTTKSHKHVELFLKKVE